MPKEMFLWCDHCNAFIKASGIRSCLRNKCSAKDDLEQRTNEALEKAMTPEERKFLYRVRILPEQLERARRRVRQLEKEAIELGLRKLVEKEQTK